MFLEHIKRNVYLVIAGATPPAAATVAMIALLVLLCWSSPSVQCCTAASNKQAEVRQTSEKDENYMSQTVIVKQKQLSHISYRGVKKYEKYFKVNNDFPSVIASRNNYNLYLTKLSSI